MFKFIINDDQWIVNDQFKVTHDEHGNSNNIIYADELVEEVDKENKANTGATSESKDKENAPESSLSETTVALKPEAKSASKPIALKMTMMPMIYQNQLFRKSNLNQQNNMKV